MINIENQVMLLKILSIITMLIQLITLYIYAYVILEMLSKVFEILTISIKDIFERLMDHTPYASKQTEILVEIWYK